MLKKKWLLLPLFLICFLILIYVCYVWNIIPHKMYTNEDFHISTYYSQIDSDADGVDDQTDILESAREYLSTKPKYESKYYGTGYPDDNLGVCTDVVAFALLGAGYDIMNLLHEDVLKNPDAYDIDVVDKNIDFRRVLNLNTYLKRHAISLSTNIYDKEEFQGGDIIVFQKHIGIISEKRNRKGINFLIHHANPFQLHYEEDILERLQKDIIGHYRIS